MRAIQLTAAGRPLERTDVPTPEPGPGETLIRVKAVGICHSDAHYRAGTSRAGPLPLTLGHEVAGVVEAVGAGVRRFSGEERVCVHYLATCGECEQCLQGQEQFCRTGRMIGKHRDGGYADYLVMPARSVFELPGSLPFEHGAIMMCSSATALHALLKARLQVGETVAVFGVGGLGASAIQLARAMGAGTVLGIDVNPAKLRLAHRFGAMPVDGRAGDPVEAIRELTGGRGVDVALELIGLPLTMRQAMLSLGVRGRAALAGLTRRSFKVAPYQELINKEAELIGVSDHLAREIPLLFELVKAGKLNLSSVVTRKIPLTAAAVNQALDRLECFGSDVRVVIEP